MTGPLAGHPEARPLLRSEAAPLICILVRGMNPEDSLYGTPKKETKPAVKPTHKKSAGIPAPFPVPDIAGPSAQELAAHDSAFLTGARSYWINC